MFVDSDEGGPERARTEFHGHVKSSPCISGPQIYQVIVGTLVFGCQNSVPRSWILRQSRQPISPSLTTYLYHDYKYVFWNLFAYFLPSIRASLFILHSRGTVIKFRGPDFITGPPL